MKLGNELGQGGIPFVEGILGVERSIWTEDRRKTACVRVRNWCKRISIYGKNKGEDTWGNNNM